MLQVDEIKKIIEEFLQKMTMMDFNVDVKLSSESVQPVLRSFSVGGGEALENSLEGQSIIDLEIELKEPQILIGSEGQTLFELQRLLRIILNKKLGKFFYLKLDINNYKKKKIEYLKNLAKDIADEVSLTKEKKILSPMPSYQRRIIHMELAQRQDIITESHGDGDDRYIVINSR